MTAAATCLYRLHFPSDRVHCPLNVPACAQELEKTLEDALARGVVPRALVVINPGNPTGNCLPLENMQAVVRFCSKHNLVLMADEVYQENIYDTALPFFSFKKVRFLPVARPPPSRLPADSP